MDTADTKKEFIYELAFVLKVGANESDLESVLTSHGAKIVNKGPAAAIALAYPIKKQTSGTFGYYHVSVPSADSVSQLSQTLGLTDAVVRFLFVKIPKEKPASAPRKKPADAEGEARKPATAPVGRIDSLSNEKLSETLEEILK